MTSSGGAARLLLDSSVLVELVISGAHVASADDLLDHLARRPDVEIATAAHGLIEAVSALRRLNLAGALGDDAAATALLWLRRLELSLDPTSPRLDEVWRRRHAMTAYDAAYAAAAVGLGIPLVSVDDRLVAACHAASIEAFHLRDWRRAADA